MHLQLKKKKEKKRKKEKRNEKLRCVAQAGEGFYCLANSARDVEQREQLRHIGLDHRLADVQRGLRRQRE